METDQQTNLGVFKFSQIWDTKLSNICNTFAAPKLYKPFGSILLTLVPSILYLIAFVRGEANNIELLIISFLIIATIIFSMLTVIMIEPGIIPRLKEECKDVELKDIPQRLFHERETNLLVSHEIKTMKYCDTCNHYRSQTIVHCKTCDVCVSHFDHHCPWLNYCIGRRNYAVYHIYIMMLVIGSMLQTIISLILLENHQQIFLILCIVYTFVGFLPIIYLQIFHFYLLKIGCSTREYFKANRIDLGLKQVFIQSKVTSLKKLERIKRFMVIPKSFIDLRRLIHSQQNSITQLENNQAKSIYPESQTSNNKLSFNLMKSSQEPSFIDQKISSVYHGYEEQSFEISKQMTELSKQRNPVDRYTERKLVKYLDPINERTLIHQSKSTDNSFKHDKIHTLQDLLQTNKFETYCYE